MGSASPSMAPSVSDAATADGGAASVEAASATRFPLRPPPPAVRPWIAVVAALVIVLPAAGGILWELATGRGLPAVLVLPLAIFAVPVVATLVGLVKRPRPPEDLVVEAETIRVPAFTGSKALVAPLAALRLVRPLKQGLALGTAERVVFLPRGMLSVAPDDIAGTVMAALAVLPGGPEHVAFLEQNNRVAKDAVRRVPRATAVVGAVIVALFAFTAFRGGLVDAAVLVDLGAARRDLVLDGAVWRLGAAALLHASLLHILLNALSLALTGPVLERWLGPSRYAVILLASALVGTAVSALARFGPATVGLSGGIFGLLGALALTSARYRAAPLLGPRLPLRSWIVLVGSNVLLSMANGVDGVAHVAGALAGAGACALLAPRLVAGQRAPALVGPRVARALAIAVALVFAGSVTAMLVRALR